MADNSLNYTSFTYKNFGAVIDKYQYNFHTKDIVAGTIFSIESKFILVDIGASQVGFLPIEEIGINNNRLEYSSVLPLKVNEIFEFYILLFDQNSQQITLSLKKAELIKAWKRLQQFFMEDIILRSELVKSNRGGCILEIEGIKGFVPRSHLINHNSDLIDNLSVKILEYNESQNYLLLSSRCAYIQKNSLIFKVGNVLKGRINLIQSYGLFVNIQHIQGLLHVSEIKQNLIQGTLDKSFNIGDMISVMIVHIDSQQGRVTLSQRGIL
uniref:ribosomal protein S1 n=1 Tax=Goniotrichopsis reniformis TaxID=468933 RepID=UPI001FCDBD9E|nr:ribosomal protein S1 [Goniotrichopsis reniformis]UNJ14894.1 ribosomal protein S1 [Goniotrichopsis reniformis]